MAEEYDCIRIWRFWEAPGEYQCLSPHEEDEGWLIHIPAWIVSAEFGYIGFLDVPAFGDVVSEHRLENGDIVLITAQG